MKIENFVNGLTDEETLELSKYALRMMSTDSLIAIAKWIVEQSKDTQSDFNTNAGEFIAWIE